MAARKRILIKALERQVIETSNGYGLIQKGDRILVALSGGADSVFLLHFLVAYQRYFNIQLSAIHLNHGLRGERADSDERFCRDLCSTLGIPFHAVRADIKALAKERKLSIEEAGRIARYGAFNARLEETGFTKLATAHHADDNLESLLLNLTKGCGINGLRGIAPLKDGYIIRPLLALKKTDIVAALEASGIGYCIDESNEDNAFERNKLRNSVIPQLRSINPEIAEATLRLSDNARAMADITSELLEQLERLSVTAKNPDGLHLEIAPLLAAPSALRTALIIKTVEENCNLLLPKNLAVQIAALTEKRSGARLAIGKEYTAWRERGTIIIGKTGSRPDIETSADLTTGKGTNIGGALLSLESVTAGEICYTLDGMTEFIDGGNISLPLTVRYWQPGDKFMPLGMQNRKNVSDFLAEQKVASREKSRQLVVCSGKAVVWVVGLRIDERFKVKSDSGSIIKLSVRFINQAKVGV